MELSNLLEDTSKSDVKIIVGEGRNVKEFQLHSLILTHRSNYFKCALSSQWAKEEDGIITFKKPNISPLAFEFVIK